MTNGELRKEWTSQEVAEATPTSSEGLPEATPVAREPEYAAASGADHMAGEESYEESSTSGTDLVPPDPPAGNGPTEGE